VFKSSPFYHGNKVTIVTLRKEPMEIQVAEFPDYTKEVLP